MVGFMVGLLLASGAYAQNPSDQRDYDVDMVLSAVTSGPEAKDISKELRRALESNPKLLAEKMDYPAAREAYRSSWGQLLPTLDFSFNTGLNNYRNDTTIARYTGGENNTVTNQQRIAVKQLLWDGGLTHEQINADEKHAESTLEEVYNTTEEITLNAIKHYLEVIRNRGILELSKRNVTNHRRIVDMVDLREQSGAGTLADVYQAEAALDEAKSKVINAIQNTQDAEAEYANVYGDLPETLNMPIPPKSIIPANVAEAIKLAMTQNKAVNAAELGIQQREHEKNSETGKLLPTFSLTGGIGRSENTSGYTQKYHDASIGLDVNWNLFNGGSDKADIRKAKSLLYQARHKYAETKRVVEKDVRTAYSFITATSDLLPVLRENVRKNDLALASYKDQFRMGTRTLLDLLKAENSLFIAEQTLMNGIIANVYSYYKACLPLSELLTALRLEDIATEFDQQ